MNTAPTIMHRGRSVVLGRRHVSPHVLGPKRMLATRLLASLPDPAPTRDWITAAEKQAGASLGEMLNDQLGCCTIAGVGHAEQIWTANTGTMVTPPDSAILNGYETVDGYVDGDASTDQGGVETDVLAAWKANGIAGSKIVDWIPVNPLNHDHVRKAIERFGLVYIGIALPKTIQTQAVWTLDISAGADAEAGSLGGHCIIVPAYDGQSYDGVTWGQRQKQSIDFWDSYVDECYAPLSDVWCRQGASPLGDTLVSLRSDLAAVA
jgi:hypothetical protein